MDFVVGAREMILDTTRLNVSPHRPIKQKKVILDLEILAFGTYSGLRLIHSDTGARNQTAAIGTADIVFRNNDFILLWAPEK